jgi:hypothetical protein
MLPWGAGMVVVFVALALAYSVSLVGAYVMFWRPRRLNRGAADEEVVSAMPGDEIVVSPSFVATRAVTMRARPEHIYPWIIQMGVGRAGWYGYDWLNNFGRPSAWGLVPHLQQPEVGDLIPMSPRAKRGMWIKELETNRRMLWWDKRGHMTWLWEIQPIDQDRSRLITRVRIKYHWLSLATAFNLLVKLIDWPMMRRSLQGIKRRAEATAPRP